MIYSMDFKNWRIEERLKLLKETNLDFTFDPENTSILVDNEITLSEGQEEVLIFVGDPASPFAMYKLSSDLIHKILPLFLEFWDSYADGRL